MALFRNFYRCDCGEEWKDEWSCTCDDRCPACNTSCSPHDSEDVDDGYTTELTPVGEQYVIPGAEKRTTTKKPQGELFG